MSFQRNQQFLSVILISLLFQSGLCQEGIDVPVSPNAYSFSKHINVPPSTYTGVIPISIPLGSISEKGAKIDISLSYHASGIKVDEVASWVGLGWSLNAGGVITRSVRDKAERPDGNGGILPNRLDIGFPVANMPGGYFSSLAVFEAATQPTNLNDIEPDIFYFNFNGRSGRFVFDKDGNVQQYKYEDIKIEFKKKVPGDAVSAVNSKFVITDELGVKYEFDTIDKTYFQEHSEQVPTAWYLTKIESPQGGVITLNYTERTANHYYNGVNSVLIDSSELTNYYWPLPNKSSQNGKEVFLQSINTNNSGKMEFTANTSNARQDYYWTSYPLDEITFYNSDNVKQKNIKFYTDYFESPEFPIAFPGDTTTFNHLKSRLKLDSIQVFSGDYSLCQPPYRFEYYDDVDSSSYTLPFRLSSAQDHWGYYNDEEDNETLIPKINGYYTPGYWLNLILNLYDDDDDVRINKPDGANREPDPDAVKAGSLHKIFYPTGGYSVYHLGQNDYGANKPAGGLRIDSIAYYDDDGQNIREIKYIYRHFSPTSDPPFDASSSTGALIDDPRNYYVLIGRGFGESHNSEPPGDIAAIFGDWSDIDYQDAGYVYKISAIPQIIMGSTQGQSVGYESIIEYEEGNGYKVSSFTSPDYYPNYWDEEEYVDPDAPLDIFKTQYSSGYYTGGTTPSFQIDGEACDNFPFLILYDNDWKRGYLKSMKKYNESKDLVYNQSIEYYMDSIRNVAGYKVYSIADLAGREYVHGKYYISANWAKLKKTTEIQYDPDGNNPVTMVTDFEYNSTEHKLLTNKKTTSSDSKLIESKIYYPEDYTSSDFNGMDSNHIVGLPIDVRSYSDSKLISGTQTEYNDIGQPITRYVAEITYGVNDISFDSTTPFTFSERVNYSYYVNTNNLSSKSKIHDITTSYIWGYNNTLPIAKVENASCDSFAYTSFEQQSNEGNWTISGGSSYPSDGITGKKCLNLNGIITSATIDSQIPYTLTFYAKEGDNDEISINSTIYFFATNDWEYYEISLPAGYSSVVLSLDYVNIDELRLYPADAQMTTYTYDPLIGMTSETDPAGRTTTYEYDEFGRLHRILDQDGFTLKQYTYHFENQ